MQMFGTLPLCQIQVPPAVLFSTIAYAGTEGYQKEKGYYRSSIPYSLEVKKVNHQSFGSAGKPRLARYFFTKSKDASDTDSQ